jgi:hypothetical protein
MFWLPGATMPLPDHGPWNRRRERVARTQRGCPGAGRPGYWIGEELDDSGDEIST